MSMPRGSESRAYKVSQTGRLTMCSQACKSGKRSQGVQVMTRTRELLVTVVAAIGTAALSSAMLLATPSSAAAQQVAAPAIDEDDIGGVVTGPNGPEAGVWVIAA